MDSEGLEILVSWKISMIFTHTDGERKKTEELRNDVLQQSVKY